MSSANRKVLKDLSQMPRGELEWLAADATFRDNEPELAAACNAEIERRNVHEFGTERPFTAQD